MTIKQLKFACVLMGFDALLIWGIILFIFLNKQPKRAEKQRDSACPGKVGNPPADDGKPKTLRKGFKMYKKQVKKAFSFFKKNGFMDLTRFFSYFTEDERTNKRKILIDLYIKTFSK